MNIKKNNSRFLPVILLYGLVAIAWNLDYNSVYHDEALNILMGRQVLGGLSCSGCAQNTGSVLIQPVLAAIGDFFGGLRGARAVGILFGLGLTAIVYFTARILFSEKYAFIAAMMFIFSGNVLYLSKLATYDIAAAFFLGLSFLCIQISEQKSSKNAAVFILFCAALSLFLSAMTKYVVAVFIPFFLIYVFLRHRAYHFIVFFLLPLLFLILIYGFYALYPVRTELIGSINSVYQQSRVPFSVLKNWTFRWVAMPYLLAFFGLFHREGKKTVPLIILSAPVIILQLLTGAEQSINKNVIFSIIFLAPAAALGIDQMGNIFSFQIDSRWVKPFFVTAVLVVLWVFGINELRWLEKQYPDMTSVISFFKENGYDGMTVTVNSDYGDATYTYSLGHKFPDAKFSPFTEIQNINSASQHLHKKADFVIIDNFHGKKYFQQAVLQYLENDYISVKKLKVPIAWGLQDVQIFKRR